MNWGFFKDIFDIFGIPTYLGLTIFLLIKSYPILKKYHSTKKEFKKDEMDKIFQLFSEEKYEKNNFLYEQVIEYKYGKPVSFREIKYILNLDSPSEAFNDYLAGRQHLAFSPDMERPNFRGFSLNPIFRVVRRWWNVCFYFFFAFLGLIAIPFISANMFEKGIIFFSANLFLLAYSLVVAYLCVRGVWAIDGSEKFMLQVEKYEKSLTPK